MARGKSGRIVIEIEPELKKNLYLELEKRELTLKDWFVMEASKLYETNSKSNSSSKKKEEK